MLVKCSYCKEEFDCKPSRYKRSKNVFCKPECHNLFRKRNTYERLSDKVGTDLKEWLKDKYLNELLSTREISIQLYGDGRNKSRVNDLMKEYGIPMRTGSEAIKTQWINNDERRELSREIANKYLNDEEVRAKVKDTMKTEEYRTKSSKAKLGELNPMYGVRGEEHPRWNPEYDSETNVLLRKDVDYVYWRKAVFDRDSYTCVNCKDNSGGNLEAHHKNGWHWDVENRYNVDNGVTLCSMCHAVFHYKYGYMNVTEKQFNRFLAFSQQ